jgi:hypothetical protein
MEEADGKEIKMIHEKERDPEFIGEWVVYVDGKEFKFDKEYKMVLTDYEKEREPEFWKCLNEGKPFNFYDKSIPILPL